jgi:hypothetical protein
MPADNTGQQRSGIVTGHRRCRPVPQVIRPPRFSLARKNSPAARAASPFANGLGSPWTGLAHRLSWYRRRQAGAAVVLAGSAISVPFPARRHRFVTVNYGHSRSSDLQAPYYRCAATRMVRMGSPVRFRRAAPHQPQVRLGQVPGLFQLQGSGRSPEVVDVFPGGCVTFRPGPDPGPASLLDQVVHAVVYRTRDDLRQALRLRSSGRLQLDPQDNS